MSTRATVVLALVLGAVVVACLALIPLVVDCFGRRRREAGESR